MTRTTPLLLAFFSLFALFASPAFSSEPVLDLSTEDRFVSSLKALHEPHPMNVQHAFMGILAEYVGGRLQNFDTTGHASQPLSLETKQTPADMMVKLRPLGGLTHGEILAKYKAAIETLDDLGEL